MFFKFNFNLYFFIYIISDHHSWPSRERSLSILTPKEVTILLIIKFFYVLERLIALSGVLVQQTPKKGVIFNFNYY